MNYAPYRSTLELLFDTAHGLCLDVGTGQGASYAVLAYRGLHVVGLETNPDYLLPFARYVPNVLRTHVQGFDYGFVDHFPIDQRWTVANWLLESGAEVVVDDARLLNPHPLFHRHDNAYHYSPKGCAYVASS